MIIVNGKPLLAETRLIIETLRDQLAQNGIKRFQSIKPTENNLMVTCPVHSDGQERKPSCGILLRKRGSTEEGTCHCFACGYTASIDVMISECFGYNDFGVMGAQWLMRNFATVSIEQRKDIELDFSRQVEAPPIEYVSEKELDSYRYYHDYMYKRGLTDELIEQFDIGYDKAYRVELDEGKKIRYYECITFPVRDETGNVLFISRRSIRQKVFYLPEGIQKPVYGLYELPEDCNEIVVCESVFDALTSCKYGKPAVALFGLGNVQQIETLKRLKARKLILAFDGDRAGRDATKRMKSRLGRHKLVTNYVMPDGKDINDLTKEEFESLCEVL